MSLVGPPAAKLVDGTGVYAVGDGAAVAGGDTAAEGAVDGAGEGFGPLQAATSIRTTRPWSRRRRMAGC